MLDCTNDWSARRWLVVVFFAHAVLGLVCWLS